MLILPRSVRVTGPRCCTVTVTTTSSVGSFPFNSSATRRRRLSDGKVHLRVAARTLGAARPGGVHWSCRGRGGASVGATCRRHCYSRGPSCWGCCSFWCILAAKKCLGRWAERWSKVALAVLLLHHTNCPLSKVDWCTLSGLQEWIGVEELSWCWALLGVLHQTLGDNVLQDRRESVTLGKFWRWLEHDLLEQIEYTLWARGFVVVFAVDAEWEFANGELHQCQADTPNVTLDCVRAALDTLWRHICASADESVCYTVLQLAAYAEIAQLDLSSAVD